MQLKLFSDKVLEDMVEDGRYFMAKRFLELKRLHPRADMSGYVDLLLQHDASKGLYDRSLRMSHFDEYIGHLKRQSEGDVYVLLDLLSKDLPNKFEVKYQLGGV